MLSNKLRGRRQVIRRQVAELFVMMQVFVGRTAQLGFLAGNDQPCLGSTLEHSYIRCIEPFFAPDQSPSCFHPLTVWCPDRSRAIKQIQILAMLRLR